VTLPALDCSRQVACPYFSVKAKLSRALVLVMMMPASMSTKFTGQPPTSGQVQVSTRSCVGSSTMSSSCLEPAAVAPPPLMLVIEMPSGTLEICRLGTGPYSVPPSTDSRMLVAPPSGIGCCSHFPAPTRVESQVEPLGSD